MSDQDNLALVKRGYEAFGKGDIEALLALMADDVELDSPKVEGVPFSGPRRGTTQMGELFRQLNEDEEVLAFEPREFIAQGDKVMALCRYRARVRATGRTAETPLVHVFTLRNGKIVSLFELYDTAAALAAYQKAAASVG
jgi:uncharacterized protein